MRRAELIAGSPAPIPKGRRKQGVILTGRIVKTSSGKVLESDVWRDGKLAFRHFTGKAGYWNYNEESKEWNSYKLGSLWDYGHPWRYFYPNWTSPEFEQKAAEFLKIEEYKGGAWGIRHDIERYENNLAWEKKKDWEKRRRARLTKEAKEETPNITKGFSGFIKKHKPADGKKIAVQIFQKTQKNEYVERQFRVENRYGKLIITEEARGWASIPGNMWNRWKYGVYFGAYGAGQEWWDRKSGTATWVLQRKFFLFTGNLEELGLSEQEITLIREIAENTECEWAHVLRLLRGETHRLAITQMMQKGLTKLATSNKATMEIADIR